MATDTPQPEDDQPDPAADQGPASPPRHRGNEMILIIGIVAVVVFCGALIFQSATRSDQPDPGPDPATEAILACENAVKFQLKAPTTAEFSGETARMVDDDYLVTGAVDAQNSFGAKIRNHFICTVKGAGAHWKASSVQFVDG